MLLSVNRDYLLLTNRLNNLVSFVNWLVGKEDKRYSPERFFTVQFLSFKVVNVLLNHQSKEDNAENLDYILNTTLQLILCSQIFKKVNYAVREQLVEEQQLRQTDLVQEMLKFLLLVLRKSYEK